MAIYLDTNVVVPWRTFAELDRLALSIVATQLGQRVVVPALVAEEAAGRLERRLEGYVEAHDQAVAQLARHFGEPIVALLDPEPDVPAAVAEWRHRLGEWAGTVAMRPDHCLEGLRREISGRAPAKPRVEGKPGIGGRDAAIWLAVLEHHRSAGEPGHLITSDSGFAADGALHPALAEEVGELPPVTLYQSVDAFVSSLGQRRDADISISELTARAKESVMAGLSRSAEIGRAVWFDEASPARQQGRVSSARATRVVKARSYESADSVITVVDAEWRLVADVLWQSPAAAPDSTWGALSDIELTGRVQVYLDNDRAEMIGAQLKSEVSAVVYEDGRVITIGPADARTR